MNYLALDVSGWLMTVTAPDLGTMIEVEVRRPEGQISLLKVGRPSVLDAVETGVRHLERAGLMVIGREVIMAAARAADAKRAGRRNIGER